MSRDGRTCPCLDFITVVTSVPCLEIRTGSLPRHNGVDRLELRCELASAGRHPGEGYTQISRPPAPVNDTMFGTQVNSIRADGTPATSATGPEAAIAVSAQPLSTLTSQPALRGLALQLTPHVFAALLLFCLEVFDLCCVRSEGHLAWCALWQYCMEHRSICEVPHWKPDLRRVAAGPDAGPGGRPPVRRRHDAAVPAPSGPCDHRERGLGRLVPPAGGA